MPAPAPPYRLEPSAGQASAQEDAGSSAEGKELLRMLTKLLQRGAQAADSSQPGTRFDWEARHVLVCVGEMYREAVARSLATGEYQVFVAEDKAQAVERMRDERMDVLILAADFDPAEQGTAFISREISSMRPTERRRLFLVQLSETGRTLDAHAAFINNVSLIVNTADIDKMARSLERSLRDYNELYRSFNVALGVSAI
jgi:response regulator RpfG family c-di-GMP phosphodiesterase